MQVDVHDRQKLEAWNEEFHHKINLRLYTGNDEKSGYFESFCRQVNEIIPNILFTHEEGGGDQVPAITLGKSWRYRALPVGSELDPFLELLAMQAVGVPPLPQSIREAVAQVDCPANLTIYVAPACPFCPEVVRQLQTVPMANDRIHLDIVDATLFPDLAQRSNVRSVPTVILDDEFRWSGSIVLQELIDALVHRDPARLTTQELLSIIKDGNADQLARMMLQRGVMFTGFPQLLQHPNWSERLGALVVLEQIAEQDIQLAHSACTPLLHYLQTAEDPVKGDLIYALGLAACDEARAYLEDLLSVEESAENREILQETLAKLGR
ncbi:thioredoxin family protein [Desulfoferrobacter suflitae]|uniref:thioredoxin family protein n=1 Tax=Desulfoferrobacter suflitae TaxID=2865782 RepID=UPI0021643500|nr:thioredoxin family protein [Desulfoferrobacter suflitae]MCK8601690.1 thioredoxin family protein [Desulfoferrobacter suflitae]